MKQILKNYVRILQIEMEDLTEDIQLLIQDCRRKREKGLITNYVCMENVALYENELHALDAFQHILGQCDPHSFADLDALLSHLKESFLEKASHSGYAKVTNILLDRKMEKLRRYIFQDGD